MNNHRHLCLQGKTSLSICPLYTLHTCASTTLQEWRVFFFSGNWIFPVSMSTKRSPSTQNSGTGIWEPYGWFQNRQKGSSIITQRLSNHHLSVISRFSRRTPIDDMTCFYWTAASSWTGPDVVTVWPSVTTSENKWTTRTFWKFPG